MVRGPRPKGSIVFTPITSVSSLIISSRWSSCATTTSSGLCLARSADSSFLREYGAMDARPRSDAGGLPFRYSQSTLGTSPEGAQGRKSSNGKWLYSRFSVVSDTRTILANDAPGSNVAKGTIKNPAEMVLEARWADFRPFRLTVLQIRRLGGWAAPKIGLAFRFT